jgi:hypothetical protein
MVLLELPVLLLVSLLLAPLLPQLLVHVAAAWLLL